MNTLAFRRASTVSTQSATWWWRVLLFAVCAGAIVLAAGRGDPTVLLRDDPELAQLLRGMAVIKAMLVVAALALLAWRFGHPIEKRFASGYLIGAALVTGASALIWQLTSIVPAAALFHVGGLLLLVVAWRDDRAPFLQRMRRAG